MKKININREEFIRVLTDGSMFAGVNRVIKILDSVKLTTHSGRIKIESSSNDNSIKVYGVCLEGTEDMSFCVNPKEMLGFLSLLGDTDIELTYDEEKSAIKIKHSHGTMKSPVFAPDEFPVANTGETTPEINISTAWLANAIGSATNFVITKNIGTSLGGVNVQITEGKIIVCGADNALIYVTSTPCDNISEDFNIIIPKTAAQSVAKMLGKTGDVSICRTDNAIIVRNADFGMTCNLVDAKYPNVVALSRHKGQTKFVLPRKELLQAVRRVQGQREADETKTYINFTADGIKMMYDYPQVNKHIEETVPCECPEFSTQFTANIDYLLSALNNYDAEDVVFYHDDNERSPLFFESEGNGGLTTMLLAGYA